MMLQQFALLDRLRLQQIEALAQQIGQCTLLVAVLVHKTCHRAGCGVHKQPLDVPVDASLLPIQIRCVLLVPTEVGQQQLQACAPLLGRHAQPMLRQRQLSLLLRIALDLIPFAILRIACALLQKAIVAHELALGHGADGHELGAIPFAIAVQFALVDLHAGHTAGLHLALGAGVAGRLAGAYLAIAQTRGPVSEKHVNNKLLIIFI